MNSITRHLIRAVHHKWRSSYYPELISLFRRFSLLNSSCPRVVSIRSFVVSLPLHSNCPNPVSSLTPNSPRNCSIGMLMWVLSSVYETKMIFQIALDLASLNIQRSRDHGLPGSASKYTFLQYFWAFCSYADYRRFCNLSVPLTWADMEPIVKDTDVVNKLRNLYGHPGKSSNRVTSKWLISLIAANIDVWVGGITERRHSEGLVGPLFACIIADQFKRLRDGDRFW